ncbi:hypothetical protein LUZ62_074067 [Rhynchospora pubera]|uniref:Uncharacterized protein n=1 Tax=Rhynchospora pubera TaxID=906938 RepID=A0AAV8DAN0_9POAL|nr:hypothetical protein LUZ62_074067 [Rhynchospora pubera]
MAIHDKLTSLPPELRVRLFTGAAIAGALLSVLAVGPSFSDVVSYFWPLLLSTAFFLFAVALVMWLSPLPASGDSATGEEILEFVTRRPPSISPEQEL